MEWEGYGEEENQWEPEAHLANALGEVYEFNQREPTKPGGKIRTNAKKWKAKGTEFDLICLQRIKPKT